jgi:putative IMPACT (imprinted ancient) family translation regulator
VPGLINAYKTAADDALTRGTILAQHLRDAYALTYAYEQMNEVMKVMKQFDLPVQNQQFDNQCTFTTEIRKTLLNQVLGRLEKIEGLEAQYLRTI